MRTHYTEAPNVLIGQSIDRVIFAVCSCAGHSGARPARWCAPSSADRPAVALPQTAAMADDTDLTEEEMMMRIMNGEDGEGGPDDLSARM